LRFVKKHFFFSSTPGKYCYCSLSTLKIKKKKMQTSQNKKHLGQSVALGLVLVVMSIGVFALMITQTGTL